MNTIATKNELAITRSSGMLAPLRFVAFAGAMIFAQTNAHADYKNYPGSMCTEPNDLSSEIAHDDIGRAYNTANGANTVVCPAVKDASAIDDAHVSVFDNHPNAAVSCIVQTRSRTGATGQWTATRSSSVANTGTYTFNWFNGLDNLTYNPGDGYHFIRCNLPGRVGNSRARVNSYRVNE